MRARQIHYPGEVWPEFKFGRVYQVSLEQAREIELLSRRCRLCKSAAVRWLLDLGLAELAKREAAGAGLPERDDIPTPGAEG